MGSESRRNSLVGWCLLTATRMCSSFTIFHFFSIVTSTDFLAKKWRKSSAEHETRDNTFEFTMLMSLLSFMILLTRLVGNSGRIVSVFSSSAIGETQASILERCLERIKTILGFPIGGKLELLLLFWGAGQEYRCITLIVVRQARLKNSCEGASLIFF